MGMLLGVLTTRKEPRVRARLYRYRERLKEC